MKPALKDIFTSSGAVVTCVVIPEGDRGAQKLRDAGNELEDGGYCKFEEREYVNRKKERKIGFYYRWSEKGKKQISVTIKKEKL